MVIIHVLLALVLRFLQPMSYNVEDSLCGVEQEKCVIQDHCAEY